MKLAKLLTIIWLLTLFASGCDTYKESQQRRNYMMPKADELPRNRKLKPQKNKKTYNSSKKNKNKSKKNR